jgi:hypothetical protein
MTLFPSTTLFRSRLQHGTQRQFFFFFFFFERKRYDGHVADVCG